MVLGDRILNGVHLRLQLGHGAHGLLNRGFGIRTMHVEEVDGRDAEYLQALRTRLLAVRPRAVNLVATRTLDDAKFGCEEDLVPLSGPLEPLPQELFAIAVKARGCTCISVIGP